MTTFKSSIKGRKLEALMEDETIASFSSLKQNLELQLASCDDFAPYLGKPFTWSTSKANNQE